MKRSIFLSTLLFAGIFSCAAQSNDYSGSEWYIGAGGGIHASKLIYSDINKDHFPENNSTLSGVFSLFGEYDFGSQRMFAVRPQISLLTRGGKLSHIGRSYYPDYNPALPDDERLTDVMYQLKATCFDIRVPLIYQFGKANWRFRPYVFVAPVFSVVNHGYVATANSYANHYFDGFAYNLNKSNIASCAFGGQVGLGVKWEFDVNGCPFFVGLDLAYEHAFTDTYGKGEKDGTAEGVSFYPGSFKVEGSRRMQAFEANMSIGIPLSIFKKRKAVAPVVVEQVVVERVEEPVEEPIVIEPNCYSLDEIISMMQSGKSVAGKKICAIDDINFAFGKSKIDASSHAYLNKLANTLKRTGASVCINGHTDNVGSEAANLELSKQRAMAVMEYLVKKGVSRTKLSYRYYGMSKPIATNTTEEGRKMNRRVEFEIY